MTAPRALTRVFGLPFRHHVGGSLALVLVIGSVLSLQVTDRRRFASGELYRDVMDRWGAPMRRRRRLKA